MNAHHPDLASFQRVISQAEPANRLKVFEMVCKEGIRLHAVGGFEKPDVVDALREIGVAAELSEDEIQTTLADAVDHPFDPSASKSPAPASEVVVAPRPTLNLLRLDELLQLEVKPRAQILSPVLPEKGLAMLYAARGMGKTHVALGMAYAVARGGSFLNWSAPRPAKCLYVDGEMPMAALKERLQNIVAGSGSADPANFNLLAADFHPNGLPNLATAEGQAALEPVLDGVDLVVLDNLSTLVPAARDNDADSWNLMQGWLLRQRRAGRAVLMCHHAGKGGQQRGTSRREDVLDTVIALRHPSDYTAEDGARFEVHIEKARGAFGTDVKPFEAKMWVVNGATQWTVKDLADANITRVSDLLHEGMSIRDIADETGLPKSTVHRLKKAAEARGEKFGKVAA
jgi:putative DNA primase/helicase